jgi:hypothetical protein
MAISAIPVGRRPPAGLLRTAALAGAAVALGAGVWLSATALVSSVNPRHVGPSPAAISAFGQRTGVQLMRVAITGGGGVVDLRYRVIDADRSAVVHDRAQRPVILDQETGELIGEPFMGMWHQHEFVKPGVTYYQLFVNREGMIRPGDEVAVRLGGVTLRDVQVR